MGDDVSNNIAEYVGFLEALDHAMLARHRRVCFQVDSLLVREQLCYKWACRNALLRPLYEEARRKLHRLESDDVEVVIDHIFRERNKHADRCANIAVDTWGSQGWQ